MKTETEKGWLSIVVARPEFGNAPTVTELVSPTGERFLMAAIHRASYEGGCAVTLLQIQTPGALASSELKEAVA